METLFYTTLETPIKPLLVASSEKGLIRIMFIDKSAESSVLRLKTDFPEITFIKDQSKNQTALDQLKEYFAGTRRNFSLLLDIRGTPFQKRVWGAVAEIPFGQTTSYGKIAARIGNANAARAVGMANHNNPLPVVIPCHRIIGADGSLTGYGAGISIKEKLLNLEEEKFESN